ncbi:MAG: hypothetical protein AAGC55_01055 [Myxococcota bacterium]
MAALSEDRIYFGEEGVGQERELQLAANAVAYAGALTCNNGSGYAAPAKDDASFTDAVGVCIHGADNSGGADGAQRIVVRRGERALFYTLPIGDENAITQADVGRNAYIVDDVTVAKASGTSNQVVAGEVLKVTQNVGLVRVTLKVGDA